VAPIANWKMVEQGTSMLRRRLGRAGLTNRAAGRVDRVIQDLVALNQATERDFLAVGGQLIAMRSSAREIAADMAAVSELIAGEQGRSASQALTRLLEHSRDIDARMEQSGQALARVRDLGIRLRQAFSGLGNLVALFRNLCTLTQIETARLVGAGADLGHLAGQIRPLSEKIELSGQGVLAASLGLSQAVEAAIRKGANLRAAELIEMPVLISGALEGLQAFEQQRVLALQASSRQASEYAAISEAIDELVGSIQLHDITRQQVEHVVEALRQLRSQWSRPAPENSGLLDTRSTVILQRSQLGHAAQLFAQSVERIERALESIAGRLQHASDAVKAVIGASERDSFFLKMETQFAAILRILGTCAAAETETESTIAALAETIGRMSAAVAEIRGTEIQIQRISTNATIRAIHIGSAGVALNKIAEVMQRLALESNASTEGAAGALGGLSDLAAGASGREQAEAAAQNPLTEEMRRALAGLHSSGQSSAGRAAHIGQLSAQLAEEIQALRAGISAGRLFAKVAERAMSELESIAEEAGPAHDRHRTREHLDRLAETYTMQRQREVHAAVVGLGADAAAVPVKPLAAAATSDLGDNVDLF